MGRCAWFHCCRKDVDLGVTLSVVGDSEGGDNEGFTQEWFDEDFGIGHTRREAEELRLQQLQIEQEIQQLQQAQEQVPYFYIREIPNKPPPPYTPPGQSPPRPGSRNKHELRRRQSRAVPASQEEITSLAVISTKYLHSAIASGVDVDLMQPPSEIYESETNDSRRVFKTFVFELTKEIVKEIYEWEPTAWHPSWEKPIRSNKRRRLVPRSIEMLQEQVKKQMLLYLGFTQKSVKENMIMTWGRKKRDFVDELLMREAHEEEESWTNYDEDEATLKNDITINILNSLLDETVKIFQEIHERQRQRAIKQLAII